MVQASLPVQLSNTSVQLVWREGVKHFSTTPLNSLKAKQIMAECIHLDTAREKVVNKSCLWQSDLVQGGVKVYNYESCV